MSLRRCAVANGRRRARRGSACALLCASAHSPSRSMSARATRLQGTTMPIDSTCYAAADRFLRAKVHERKEDAAVQFRQET